VLKAVGKHVDVFSTQALILSRHRPPEWQQFQADGWDHEMQMTGKPILVVDWAAPFSLSAAFDSEHGSVKTEAEAAVDSARWLTAALAHPGIIGVFRCQLIGTHGNDRWFEGKAKRTYLKDDGTPNPEMAAKVSEANRADLKAAYDKVTDWTLQRNQKQHEKRSRRNTESAPHRAVFCDEGRLVMADLARRISHVFDLGPASTM
jgi:hypothetical protein